MIERRPLPAGLRPSFLVDYRQLRSGARPVIRSQLAENGSARELRRWARRNGHFLVVDTNGFFALSPSPVAARRVMRIDVAIGKHCLSLGRALGYPPCCCLAARRWGDERLDEWSERAARRRHFGRFKLISPTGYRLGDAKLSHVPCCSSCKRSLDLALRAKGVPIGLRSECQMTFGRSGPV